MMSLMSDIFQQGMSWHTYLNLERDFIDVTRYVALDRDNGGVWSERIAQLLLLTGSTVDSVFYAMRTSTYLPQTEPIDDLRRNLEPHIGNYRDAYEPIYQLSGIELRARYGLSDYGVIMPFQPFAANINPRWWEDYNDAKHEFFQEMCKGTLDNLVHALGALFALNVLHMDSKKYLANTGLIQIGYLGRKMILPMDRSGIWNYLKDSFIGSRCGPAFDCLVNSEVFLHVFRKDTGPS